MEGPMCICFLTTDNKLQNATIEQIKMEIDFSLLYWGENVCDICQLDFFSAILRDIYIEKERKEEWRKERKRICNVLWFIKNVKWHTCTSV